MIVQKLKGNLVSLSPITIECAAKWTEWLNDLEVSLPLGADTYRNVNLLNQKEAVNEFSKQDSHCFSIIANESRTIIGRCLFFNLDPVNRNTFISIFIGDKKHWGKGYGEDALKLLLDYGFSLLNLNNISLGVYSFNKRAIECYKKVGFKEIGVRREARIIGGKAYDAHYMDMIAREYTPFYLGDLIEKVTGG